VIEIDLFCIIHDTDLVSLYKYRMLNGMGGGCCYHSTQNEEIYEMNGHEISTSFLNLSIVMLIVLPIVIRIHCYGLHILKTCKNAIE
jgi:hypothetical protein